MNWYVVDGGSDGLTVVDAGLSGYHRTLDRTLAAVGGSRADVRAVVLTHGHIDHVGMAGVLAAAGATVYVHRADHVLAGNPRSNTTERSLLPYLRYPATLGFVGHALAQGALRPPPLPPVTFMADGTTLDIPGLPLVIRLPGHTSGSCALHFPDHDVLTVGDLLCTVSPVTGRPAPPQVQTRGSSRDSAQNIASLDDSRASAPAPCSLATAPLHRRHPSRHRQRTPDPLPLIDGTVRHPDVRNGRSSYGPRTRSSPPSPPSGTATLVTRGPGSHAAGLAMAFTLTQAAQDRWRVVNAPHLVALVRAGATFTNGRHGERPEADASPTTAREQPQEAIPAAA